MAAALSIEIITSMIGGKPPVALFAGQIKRESDAGKKNTVRMAIVVLTAEGLFPVRAETEHFMLFGTVSEICGIQGHGGTSRGKKR